MNRESNCLDAFRGRDRVRWRQEPNGLFGDIVKIGKGGRKKSLLFHTHTHTRGQQQRPRGDVTTLVTIVAP